MHYFDRVPYKFRPASEYICFKKKRTRLYIILIPKSYMLNILFEEDFKGMFNNQHLLKIEYIMFNGYIESCI